MTKGTNIFIVTMVLFATGTSVIGYSLAKETSQRAPVQASFTLIDSTAAWYCVPQSMNIKAQAAEDSRSGYYTAGYFEPRGGDRGRTPGYQPAVPGYTPPPSPGYQPDTRRAPERAKPGYTIPTPGYQPVKPGYVPPSPGYYTTPGYEPPAKPPLSSTLLTANWTGTLKCPTGYKPYTQYVQQKCLTVLQNKLNGAALPAESKEQYYTCKGIFKPQVWDAKISQKICGAFYSYEKDCTAAQKKKKKCVALSTYLTKAGVAKKNLSKTQSDAIYLCKNVYAQ